MATNDNPFTEKMELNDQVKVTLTAYGASVLNEDNELWKKRYPNVFSSEKTD